MRIGVDVGGTNISAGIARLSGEVFYRKKIKTEKAGGFHRVCRDIADLIGDIIRESEIKKGEIERVGIACAGQIDRHAGDIIFSPNLGWRDVPLKTTVEGLTDMKVFVENDVNAAVYGEWRFALNAVPRDVVGVYVGTGIGGGIIIDGRLYRGYSSVGGEIGHITVNVNGYRCNCGNTGCLEAHCGGAYIIERVKGKIKGGHRGVLWDIIGGDVNLLNTGHVEEAYLLGDNVCGKIWREVIEHMGAGLASIANMLNPEVIILGGGVVYGSRRFIEEVVPVMEKRAMAASLKGLRIERATMGEDSAILGAAFNE